MRQPDRLPNAGVESMPPTAALSTAVEAYRGNHAATCTDQLQAEPTEPSRQPRNTKDSILPRTLGRLGARTPPLAAIACVAYGL